MNEIINTYLLAGDKAMHLKKPGFTYSDSGPLTKNKEKIQEFKEFGDLRYIYQN